MTSRSRWQTLAQGLDEAITAYLEEVINHDLAEATYHDRHGVSQAEADPWTPPTMYGENDPDDYLIAVQPQGADR